MSNLANTKWAVLLNAV